jgi:hypothetical protein
MLRMKTIASWKEGWEPQAELIGNLTHPDIFKQYKKAKDQALDAKKTGKSQLPETKVGNVISASTNIHYDPMRGLVDDQGRVLIPKEKYDKELHLDGVAITY